MEPHGPLAVVGVDTMAEQAYRLLLSQESATVDDVVAALGVPAEEGLAILESLHHAGLMSRRSSGEFFTVDPRHALRALIEARERQLAAIRDATGPLGELFDAAGKAREGGSGTGVICGLEAIGDRYYRLKQSARTELCALDRPPFLLAPNEPLDEAAVRRGVRVRAVYAAASFETDGGWQDLGNLVSRGEEARVVPALPIKLAMADRSAAMVSLTLSVGRAEYLYTESPPLLEALGEFFESYWSAASPLTEATEHGTPAGETAASTDPVRQPTDAERTLLALFAAGVKDEAIARKLGISPRTLRRRIQDLFAELGATNRFGAGVAAAHRHWI